MVIWWALGWVLNTVVDVVMFMATAMRLKDTETPIKGTPGFESRPRRFVHRTTINDVALGVTQAGLSRYLNRIYGGEGKKDDVMILRNH